MPHQPFSISATLKSPPIFSQLTHAPTLDALLAYARFIESGEDVSAIHDLPLKRTKGVFHGSVPAFASPVSPGLWPMIRSIGKEEPEGVYHRGRGKPMIDLVRGTFKVDVDRYQTLWPIGKPKLSLTWFGYGDMTRAYELLNTFIHGVGKRNHKGLGEIREEWGYPEAMDEDESWIRKDQIMRPVPVDIFESETGLSADNFNVDVVSFQPDYFRSGKTECVMPALVTYLNPVSASVLSGGKNV